MSPPSALWRYVSMALVVLTGLVVISDATQIMRRPPQYKNRPNTFAMERQPKVHTLSRRATGKANFAYFTNWGIYGANFQPTDIVPDYITHILYSFADTDASTGAIKLTDPYSDEQKRFPGDTWTETGNNLYGCLKQLYLLKMKKRDLKVLLSIGGWTYSQAGHFNFVTNPTARAKFISDAVQLIEDYGFDGIDIDYEYPSTPEQGQGLADLVTSLRTALTQLASRKGESNPYLITAAVGAGPAGYSNLKVAQMDRAMDYWNLMAYDYAGSWLTWADNQANFYGGARTGYSTDAALKWYISQGATKSKINVGMPLYGRAFQNTDGLGAPYSGIGPGTIEPGIYSYKALPLAGGQVYENKTDMTSYSYDPVKRELVSYDTPNIVRMKAIYVEKNGLGGTMFWELSTDKVGSESLVAAAASRLGALDSTPNHIKFPNSKWDNIRNNMSGGGSTTTAPAPTPTGGTPAPTGGPCAGVSAWSATTIYTGGNRATYSGRLWTARWWTQGETPGTAEVWTNSGAC
ncbi:endochitinase [Coprinopsis cinerea AmutBmut pab1-1]|nr:endochitinase [Coprinopsis cinerea AmutBmut pab1-1]